MKLVKAAAEIMAAIDVRCPHCRVWFWHTFREGRHGERIGPVNVYLTCPGAGCGERFRVPRWAAPSNDRYDEWCEEENRRSTPKIPTSQKQIIENMRRDGHLPLIQKTD